MFDPAKFNVSQGARRKRRPGRCSALLLRAASGIAVGAALMPWFVFVRAWFGPDGLVWLGAWALAGLVAVPAWRGAVRVVRHFGLPRLALVAGVLAALIVVAHVLWFAFGWVPFRPLCMEAGSGLPTTIEGRLEPAASRYFIDMLRTAWGDDAVSLDEEQQILVRPGLASIPASILWNHIVKDSWIIAAERGIAAPDMSQVRCANLGAFLMQDGRFTLKRGWGIWPYNMIDESGLLGGSILALAR